MCSTPSSSGAKPLLAVLKGEHVAMPPRWMMRQAGRYLPEYRALRAEKGGFLELVYDSEAAAEITLQPLRRFGTERDGLHGAILFSDILIVPYAMGQNLWFEAGEGPRLAPPLADTGIGTLTPDWARYDPIYDTVRRVKAQLDILDPSATFLGFAGSPWTIATYMVAGQGSKDHGAARRLAYGDPDRFGAIIGAIVDATVPYLAGQIDAGVEAVQLFDSWAGSLSPEQFEQWVIAPNRAIVERLRQARPGVPIIGFPKGAGAKLIDYAEQTGVDAVGLDETIDPRWADTHLPPGMPVQGNLDPLALIAGGAALDRAIDRILGALRSRPHIFNLGHGILPDTPVDHVAHMLSRLGGMNA